MTKTFYQLVDELHKEMEGLKRKYPGIHLTEHEKKIRQITTLLNSRSVSSWAIMMQTAMNRHLSASTGVFIETARDTSGAFKLLDLNVLSWRYR